MNRFDQRLQRAGLAGGWLSSGWKAVKDVVKKPSELWENEKILLSVANPTLAVNTVTLPVEKTVNEAERSKVAQAALAILANPALANVAGHAKWAKENPEHAMLVAAAAAAYATAGSSWAAYGKEAAGIVAGGAVAKYAGKSDEEVKQQMLNAGTQAAGNILFDLVDGTGIDLSFLGDVVSPEKITSELNRLVGNGLITPQQAAEIRSTISGMRNEGKTDQQIINELINSEFFKSLSNRALSDLTHPILYNDFLNHLLALGYDHNTASRVAMQLATIYSKKLATESTTNLVQTATKIDNRVWLALLPVALFFIMRK